MAETFWNTVFGASDVASMLDKYGWVQRAVLEPAAAASAAALREAARRWPGSLREHQRVSPERYRAREQWVRQGVRGPLRAYAAWRDEGRAAICLWSELHRGTAEALAWRAAAPVARRADVKAFLWDLTQRDPARRAAWPEAVVLSARASLGAGLAEACLAHRAGWDRPALRACLLDLSPR